MTGVTLKIVFTLPTHKQEIRRFTTTEREVLPAVLAFLDATYAKFYQPPLRFLIQYDDGEDLLTVSSEVELQEGLAFHRAHGGGAVWKLLCRFDDAPQHPSSGLHSPAVGLVSGVSTPSSLGSNDFPPSPSPSMTAGPSVVVVEEEPTVAVAQQESDEEVEQPTQASATLLPQATATSPRSDEDDLIDVGHSSDDEYVRIEDEPATGGVATSPTASLVDRFIEQRAAERFACLLCPKLFKGRQFVSDHVRNRHADALKPAAASSTQTDAAPASVEFSTQTSSPASVDQSTATTPGSVSTPTPKVDEPSPKSHQPVEIADVTGHHEHVEASPAPVETPAAAETVNAPAAAAAAASAAVVHSGITCDGCGMSPLVGNRYHCTVCTMPGGFDLCESCEHAGDKHPAAHVLLKMRTAAHIPVGGHHAASRGGLHCPARRQWHHGGASAPRPKAAFISDVTLADGLQVHAGETLQKIWSIKNVGETAWPHGTKLVFAGGDLAPESESRADAFGAVVPFAGPGDVVHVSIAIQVPNEIGRFRGTFRLETPHGLRFGPRIWIDLVVPAEDAQADGTPAETQQPEAEAEEAEEVKQVAAEKAAPMVEAESPKAAAPMPVAMPVAVPASASAPSPSAPSGPSSSSSECKQSEEEQLAAAFAASHVTAAAELKKSTPAFQYSNQLAILRSMGFKDQELCRYLLLNNQGDVQKVVAWLINNTK